MIADLAVARADDVRHRGLIELGNEGAEEGEGGEERRPAGETRRHGWLRLSGASAYRPFVVQTSKAPEPASVPY